VTIRKFGRVIIQGDDPGADEAIIIMGFHFEGTDGTLGAQREALIEARDRLDHALVQLEQGQVNIA
jgi:hypothetical protein